jgi:hypothetical protein
MLPKEQTLANRLSIAMHDWPAESRANMIEWVTDALKEQREHVRDTCAALVEGHEELGEARLVLAAQIRNFPEWK